jgi:hypothetical protein
VESSSIVGITPGVVVVSRKFRRSTFVAYEVHDLGNGKYEIRTTSGRTCHIVRHHNDGWTVDEDNAGRTFPSFDDALDCAREIAGDPDLPPVTQV